MSYIDVPVVFDETDLYNTAIAVIQDQIPGWTPVPGSLIDILLRTCASMAAVGAQVASNVPFDIFQAFGTLASLPPLAAQSAEVSSTWTVQDTNGYLIPALTPVSLTSSSTPTPLGFLTLDDLIIPPGQTTGMVTLVAAIAGSASNGLNTVIRADSLSYVTGVAITGSTANGQDAELSSNYVNRLAGELATWTTTPVIGSDFATLAQNVPGVYRCAEIDNFIPPSTTGSEGDVTVCPIDINGAAVSSPIQTAVQTYLQSLVLVNFNVHVTTPTLSQIDVSYTGVVSAEQAGNIANAEADVFAALTNLISPATWGIPLPQAGEIPQWENTTVLRINTVIQTIANVLTITYGGYVSAVTTRIHGGTLASTDITLSGAFPLVTLNTVTPTVTAL